MPKFAKIVGVVAAVVALSIAIPGVGTALGISAATAATIGAVATAVAVVANVAAQALQRAPPAQGTVSQVLIGNNLPVPYAMGRTMSGGMMVQEDSGGTNNENRVQVMVLSGAGPIDSFESFLVDYVPTAVSSGNVTGWYSSFMNVDTRLGTRPDTALTSGGTGVPGFGSQYGRSGWACYRVAYKFDKKGERYSGGLPQVGWIAKMVKVYDPRKDSTYPGGSGAHRWADEATWEWSENPGLHALTYARGRFMNGKKVCGVGLEKDQIDIPTFVEFANLCDANSWKIGGTVYEGPGTSKWDNIKRICQAGAAQPAWTGGKLTLQLSAPRSSLVTITPDLLAGNVNIRSGQSWRERKNTVIPRYRSEAHRWEYVQADAVQASTYLAEDGEVKSQEIQFDLVQDVNQAAQLAAYEMTNGRELGPIVLVCKPQLLPFRIGEAATLDMPELGLVSQPAVIIGRQVDVIAGTVTLTFKTETLAKHAYCLGLLGGAPPTPSLHTPGEIDQVATQGATTEAEISQLINNSFARDLTFSLTNSGTFTISNHSRVYADKQVAVTGNNLGVTASVGDLVMIYYDDPTRQGGAVVYQALVVPGGVGPTEVAATTPANPYRHFLAAAYVPNSTTGSTSGGTGAGSGGGGRNWVGRNYEELP